MQILSLSRFLLFTVISNALFENVISSPIKLNKDLVFVVIDVFRIDLFEKVY